MIDISVIIAHIGDPLNLLDTIKYHYNALKDSGFSYEIIICDNGSLKDELAIVEKFVKRNQNKYHLKLIYEKTLGTIPPFQTAAKEATGKYMCISDCHIRLHDDYYVKQIPLLKGDVALVYAAASFEYDNCDDLVYGYGWSYSTNFRSGWMSKKDDNPYYVGVSQMGAPIVNRKAFIKAGMFSESAFEKYGGYTAEELLLGLKIWMFGYKALMNPKVHYHHAGRHAGRSAGKKEQPAALSMLAYLLWGEDRAKRMIDMWSFGEDSDIGYKHTNSEYGYKSKDEALEDIKKIGKKDRQFIVNNVKYNMDELLKMWKKLGVIDAIQ